MLHKVTETGMGEGCGLMVQKYSVVSLCCGEVRGLWYKSETSGNQKSYGVSLFAVHFTIIRLAQGPDFSVDVGMCVRAVFVVCISLCMEALSIFLASIISHQIALPSCKPISVNGLSNLKVVFK